MNRILCPRCGKRAKYPDEYAGKTVKCPKCGQSITLPARASILSPNKSGTINNMLIAKALILCAILITVSAAIYASIPHIQIVLDERERRLRDERESREYWETRAAAEQHSKAAEQQAKAEESRRIERKRIIEDTARAFLGDSGSYKIPSLAALKQRSIPAHSEHHIKGKILVLDWDGSPLWDDVMVHLDPVLCATSPTEIGTVCIVVREHKWMREYYKKNPWYTAPPQDPRFTMTDLTVHGYDWHIYLLDNRLEVVRGMLKIEIGEPPSEITRYENYTGWDMIKQPSRSAVLLYLQKLPKLR